jgi:hypothetical protein
MAKTFTITISALDLGQTLDGIRDRMDSWNYTAEYMETGYSPDDTRMVEECSSAEEARKIADHYSSIISSIEEQMAAQG